MNPNPLSRDVAQAHLDDLRRAAHLHRFAVD
jgi:hypothetical protein